MDEETILKVIAAGGTGFQVCAGHRVVTRDMWASRRVLSMFIEPSSPGRILPAGRVTFTDRDREVLEMLLAGFSIKERCTANVP